MFPLCQKLQNDFDFACEFKIIDVNCRKKNCQKYVGLLCDRLLLDKGPAELTVSRSLVLFSRLTDPTSYYQDLMASLQPAIRVRWVTEPCTWPCDTALILKQATHLRTEAYT